MIDKRNLKEERGITLLALIITIIIIVIIAAITISAAYMSGIIQFGVNGARDYAQAAIEENKIMGETEKYVESVTKKIKVLLGEEPPTNPELEGMDWFVKGVTQPAEESKEVADFYAKGKPEGTLIIYPKNGIEATIEYVEVEVEGPGGLAQRGSVPPWLRDIVFDSDVILRSELAEQITSVYVAKGVVANTCQSLFSNLPNCSYIDFSNLDTNQVTSMEGMFNGCFSLKNVDLSALDTKQVTNMSSMFSRCNSLEGIDFSPLNTSCVTDMSFMFQGAQVKGLDLTGLNTENVENMEYMFSYCSSLESIDLKGWDVRKVTNMYAMFDHCSNLTALDLSDFVTENVTDFTLMFSRLFEFV